MGPEAKAKALAAVDSEILRHTAVAANEQAAAIAA
jgi:hypothetical protein